MSWSILILNLIGLAALWLNLGRPDRFRIAVTVMLAQGLFYLIGEIEDAFTYYAAAACFDLVTIVILSKVSNSRLSIDIQLVTFSSLLVNALGYMAYEAGVSSFYYNTALSAVLFVQLVRLLIVTRDDDREAEDSALWDLVRRLGLLGGQGDTGQHEPTPARRQSSKSPN